MDEDFKKEMQDSTLKEILDSIEDAKNGELSPHWQEHIRREVQHASEGGYLPENSDELLSKLRSSLDSVPQIGDSELNRRQLAASNTELIYDYPSDDYGTLVQITYMPDKRQYTASVFLDPDKAQHDLPGYSKNIEQARWTWIYTMKIDFDEMDVPQCAQLDSSENFDSIKDALKYVFSALRHPETLL